MAAGDTLRRITPNDQLILNSAGAVVGIKNPNANGGDLVLTPTSAAVGALLDRRNRKLFNADKLADWSASALGGTITDALDTADGYYAGGSTITMTQSTTAGPKNVLTSPIPFYVPATGNQQPWFATWESTEDLGQFTTMTATDTGATNFWTVQVGLPNNQIVCKTIGAADLTVNPTNFSQATRFRIMVWVYPSTALTGTIRYFLYYKDTVSGNAVNLYLGSQDYSGNTIPSKFIFTQSWVATGVAKLERFVSGEFYGVMNGCSLEAGYVGWAPSPESARTFAAGAYSRWANPAYQLAQRMNGDGDWYVNHACGGYRVDQMLADYTNFVINLKPKFIALGSATNSIMAALALTGAARAAYMVQAKADFMSMVTQGLAIGAVILVNGIAPRHDAVALANLAAYRGMAYDWNTWLAQVVRPLGVAVADFFADLEDPAAPGQLASTFDAGDHVHWNYNGRKVMADSQYQALMRLRAI